MATGNTVVPKLELDTVLANYDNPVLVDRLVTIYRAKNHLSINALRHAIRKSKEGSNVDRYSSLVAMLHDAQPSDPLADQDLDWLNMTRKKSRLDAERLNNELNQYKNNLIKESIRVRDGKLNIFVHR
jgi:COP9 signalosome complex subunit 1